MDVVVCSMRVGNIARQSILSMNMDFAELALFEHQFPAEQSTPQTHYMGCKYKQEVLIVLQ
jgi:hypothetical protein